MKRQKTGLTGRNRRAKVETQSPALNTTVPSRGHKLASSPTGATRGVKPSVPSRDGHRRGFFDGKKKRVLTNKRAKARMVVQSPAVGRKEHRGGFLTPNKDIVLIDGENFVHGLVRNLKKQGLVKSRSSFYKINIAHIASFARGADVHYYSTMIKVPRTSPLSAKAKKIAEWNGKWIPYLANQGVKIIKAGLLRVRDGKTCPKCGAKSEVLLEKGVDVRVAIDIVSLSSKRHRIFVLSSDTDLVPAIERAVSMGHKVVYVAFPGDVVRYIADVASKVIELRDDQIEKAFKEVR